MRGYEEDEYEDWDEYQEAGEEQEEQEGDEDGHEETQQPTQEELEYLSLRQRIKESIRKKRKNELGTGNTGSHNDNYGSFFGPSRPVIAQRVIQESRSLLENPDLAAKFSRLNHTKNTKSSISAPVKSKSQSNHTPRATNGLKKKVEMIKNTRDYSFLLSEDTEVPASTKTAPPRSLSTPKSNAQSPQLLPRSKQEVNGRRREVSDGHDRRKPLPGSSQSKPKVEPGKMAPTSKLSVDSRKQLGNNNGSGPGRPLGPRGMPSKSPLPTTGKLAPPTSRNTAAGANKPTPPLQSGARKSMPSNLHSGTHGPTPLHGQPSHLKKSTVPRKEHQEARKPKVIPKQALPPPRDQLRRPPPKLSAPGTSSDERPKPKHKRPIRDDSENAINMIRQMFGYNPNKFRDDDDDSDMEANFDDIMKEEKQSARIARKEDEEQLQLIEEEERRERARLAKKRKLSRQ